MSHFGLSFKLHARIMRAQSLYLELRSVFSELFTVFLFSPIGEMTGFRYYIVNKCLTTITIQFITDSGCIYAVT